MGLPEADDDRSEFDEEGENEGDDGLTLHDTYQQYGLKPSDFC